MYNQCNTVKAFKDTLSGCVHIYLNSDSTEFGASLSRQAFSLLVCPFGIDAEMHSDHALLSYFVSYRLILLIQE